MAARAKVLDISTARTERLNKHTESEAQRRGRLASAEPGEMVFSSQLAAVEAVQAQVRSLTRGTGSDLQRVKQKDIAKEGEMSSSTVANMSSGKTHFPRFSTMFGISNALGLEVVFRPRSTPK